MQYRKIMKEIQTTATKYVLAVSGGVDSMAMLSFFNDICDKDKSISFVVCHFNHNIRNDSYLDEQLVADFCANHNIEFYSGQGHNIKSECDARDQRYAFLRAVRANVGAAYIVTAHHWQDQCETVLMRLVRGIPLDNLGMKKISGDIYRPFLEENKENLMNICLKNKIPWREDSTNTTLDYQRNVVRNAIIPLLDRNIYKAMRKNIKV